MMRLDRRIQAAVLGTTLLLGGLCLAVSNYAALNGTRLVLTTCGSNQDQRFVIH